MNQEEELITLEESFEVYKNHQDDSVIILDSEEEYGDQNNSRDPLQENFVIQDTPSPRESSATCPDILENSLEILSKPSNLISQTQKWVKNISEVRDSICLAPDSDYDSSIQENVSENHSHSLNFIDDSSSSISSKSGFESPGSCDASFPEVKKHSSTSTSYSQKLKLFDFLPEDPLLIKCNKSKDASSKKTGKDRSSNESKSGLESPIKSSDVSYEQKKQSSNANSSKTELCSFRSLPENPASRMFNASNDRTFPQYFGKDRLSNDSNSSISSMKMLPVNTASRMFYPSNDRAFPQNFGKDRLSNDSNSSTSSIKMLTVNPGSRMFNTSNDHTFPQHSGKDRLSNESNSSISSIKVLSVNPTSKVFNTNPTFPQNFGKDRFSNESTSSLSSVKSYDLDTSSQSRHNLDSTWGSNDSNSSSSSLKEKSLTEKQKMARRVQELADNIKKKKLVLRTVDLATLPDRGVRLQLAVNALEKELKILRHKYENMAEDDVSDDDNQIKPEAGYQGSAANEYQATVTAKGNGSSSNINNLGVIRGMDSVTMDALKNLHDSLKTCPNEHVLAEEPNGLKVSLMPHQSHGLAWMLWREQQVPTGGILADDMGLGKTLSMISLVLKHKEINGDKTKKDGNLRGGTLIVCPTSLLEQWKKEVEHRCKQSVLSLHVHHGTDRTTSIRSLMRYDIVITTYGIVMRECESIRNKGKTQKGDGPLHLIDWTRIILDEAHVVRNHKSQTSQAVSCLKGTYRWALTGTPIQNKELDLFALIVFLRCEPFDKYLTWRRWVDNKTAAGSQRLNLLMKSLMLRRTKDQLQSKGSLMCLPSREQHHIDIDLDEDEKTVYDQILLLSRSLFAKFLDQQAERAANQINDGSSIQSDMSKPSSISNPFLPGNVLATMKNIPQDRTVKSYHLLVLLLRLRQICSHPGLIKAMLNDEDCKDNEIVGDSGLDADLISQMNAINLLDNNSKKDEPEVVPTADLETNPLTLKNPVFNFDRPSSKLNALLQCLKEKVLVKQDKAVVVSQWTSMLDLIGTHLKKNGIKYLLLSGSVPLKARMEVIESFNNSARGPQVLLLSLKAGGVGLNLIGGNHLILVDLHWNPQLEAQACDRIYRVGQKKDVHVYRLVCKYTVEEKIFELQEKKLSLAESVLTGAGNPQNNKLSLADLKILFSS